MENNLQRRAVLFVCTGNAGRSQMAQAMFRHLTQGEIDVYSAGVEPWPDLHPMARKLMAEMKLDLAGHYPKHVNTLLDTPLDIVVTIGEPARKQTPDFGPTVRRIHWPIDDPADADGTADSEAVFRKTRELIAQRFDELLKWLEPC